MLHEKYIARIYSEDENGTVYVGTAYPITSKLLITALHVVRFKNQNTSKDIEIVWDNIPREKDKVSVDSVIYDSAINDKNGENDKNTYDIALLPCETNFNNVEYPTLYRQNTIAENQQYISRGFPLAGQNKNKHDAIPISGEIVGGYKTAQLELLAKTEITAEADWAGLSGAPVFVSGELVAIITKKYSTVKKFLYAVSISYVLNQSQIFCDALNISNNKEHYQNYLEQKKQQIYQLIEDNKQSKLYRKLARHKEIALNLDTLTPKKLSSALLNIFDNDRLTAFDVLLQAGESTLKESREDNHVSFKQLFCLLSSLMAPQALRLEDKLLKLNVYTPMSNEIHLAPLFNMTPVFSKDKDDNIAGEHAINASTLVKENGWDDFEDDVVKTVFKKVYKKDPPEHVDSFAKQKLNTVIKQRRNEVSNQLYRLELNIRENEDDHILASDDNCKKINNKDCLPELPIIHYGESATHLEAELSAKINDLFDILERYGVA